MRNDNTPWNRSYKAPPVDSKKRDKEPEPEPPPQATRKDADEVFERRSELDAELERRRNEDALKDPWD